MAHVPRPMTAPDRLDEALRIETAEQVTLDLPIAGLALRGLAFGLDGLLAGLIIWAVLSLLGYFHLEPDTGNAVTIAVSSLIALSYYAVLEYRSGGLTPGKRLLRLRVVDYQGDPPTGSQVLLRNLLRIIDFMLILMGIELFVLFWSPRNQRLGDFAAGTVVVRELPLKLDDVEDSIRAALTAPLQESGWLRKLGPAERELVRRYGLRAAGLPPEERADLAARIVARILPSLASVPDLPHLPPEAALAQIGRALAGDHR
ncbi:MAG: RDD family protein [bacterium]